MIPFNKAVLSGNEFNYMKMAYKKGKLSGDGYFTHKCHNWLKKNLNAQDALLTHSATAALEMSAILLDIKPGDEIIMPSYTFVSTANAFVMSGATPVFVDIDRDTLCIDENLIEEAINKKTRAIVPVHYAGISPQMHKLQKIGKKNNLTIIEDAAQGILSKYNEEYLGTIGDLGCFSFHETKNITCGEGGALIINNEDLYERAQHIREKGTNRNQFISGKVDKYTWVDKGSSFLPGEINAAFLLAQLERSKLLTRQRIKIWNKYDKFFKSVQSKFNLELPNIPKYNKHNAHMYYVLFESKQKRDKFMKLTYDLGVNCVFHYIPLHSAPAGKKFGKTVGKMNITNDISSRLLRMPLWVGIEKYQEKIFTTFERVLSKV
tara:strand:+ start:535 stop:1665 length:1131 start_codon:yes stop_codon:yes gene_type:complete